MSVDTRLGAEGILGPFDDPEKIVRSIKVAPNTLLVTTEAGGTCQTGRDENTAIGTSGIAEVLAAP